MAASAPSTYTIHEDTVTIQINVSDTTAEAAFVVPDTEIIRLPDGTYDFNRIEDHGPILAHWQKYIGEYVAQSYLKLPSARSEYGLLTTRVGCAKRAKSQIMACTSSRGLRALQQVQERER